MDVHLALAEGLKGLPVEDPAGVLLSSGIQAPTWDEAWAAAVELATSWAWEEAKETTSPGPTRPTRAGDGSHADDAESPASKAQESSLED